MPVPADVMNRFFPFLPPYVPQGGRGCSSLPPHPLTTIDSGFTFQRDVSKELLAALMGCTSWFFSRWRGVVGCMWSAEALLPAAGAVCALRFEPEPGDWSCWKLWMDNNDFLRHRQGGPEVHLRAGQHKANPPGHPHNVEENRLK